LGADKRSILRLGSVVSDSMHVHILAAMPADVHRFPFIFNSINKDRVRQQLLCTAWPRGSSGCRPPFPGAPQATLFAHRRRPTTQGDITILRIRFPGIMSGHEVATCPTVLPRLEITTYL